MTTWWWQSGAPDPGTWLEAASLTRSLEVVPGHGRIRT